MRPTCSVGPASDFLYFTLNASHSPCSNLTVPHAAIAINVCGLVNGIVLLSSNTVLDGFDLMFSTTP